MLGLHRLRRLRHCARVYSTPKPTKRARDRISAYLKVLASPQIEKILAPHRERVKSLGDEVRRLKESEADQAQIDDAVAKLKAAKEQLQNEEARQVPPNAFVDQLELNDLLTRRFFFDRSYPHHAGLYDLGPLGVQLQRNVIEEWRQFFVVRDRMLEVQCPTLTPAEVFRASGHVDRFADFVVRDLKTGRSYRADHLIEEFIESKLQCKSTPESVKESLERTLASVPNQDARGLQQVIDQLQVKSKDGNELSPPQPVNLMFPTQLGPMDAQPAYLRPETAQGIFLNFRRLFQYNGYKLPLAAAQIGTAYRNEVAPRQGLVRTREFQLCEVEHFYDAAHAQHARLDQVDQVLVNLWSAADQLAGRGSQTLTVRDALASGLPRGPILAYYMAKTQRFLETIGLDAKRLRFRQHLPDEMAHYAKECWDAEALTAAGWLEVAGHADRHCHDLRALSRGLGLALHHHRQPSTADHEPADDLYPHVVEPSFGVGRILTALLDHAYRVRRPDAAQKRPYLDLAPRVAPVQVTVYPVVREDKFRPHTHALLHALLEEWEVRAELADGRYSLGRRYARADESGVPLGVTVDERTLRDRTVTVRHVRDLSQLRARIDDQLGQVVRDVLKHNKDWEQVKQAFETVERQEPT